jgi:hypothetical protein
MKEDRMFIINVYGNKKKNGRNKSSWLRLSEQKEKRTKHDVFVRRKIPAETKKKDIEEKKTRTLRERN